MDVAINFFKEILILATIGGIFGFVLYTAVTTVILLLHKEDVLVTDEICDEVKEFVEAYSGCYFFVATILAGLIGIKILLGVVT